MKLSTERKDIINQQAEMGADAARAVLYRFALPLTLLAGKKMKYSYS